MIARSRMDRTAMWTVVERERSGLADLLSSLDDRQWACPSLCAGWTVREVAAHLTLGPRMGVRAALIEFVRARGDFDRMVDGTARREARRPVGQICAELRRASTSRHLAPGQSLADAMLDVLVHGQDIAVPLGVERPMPPEPARLSADHVLRRGFPFHARRRLGGLRLTATDVDWSTGEGPRVAGPIAALLLLLTGRTDAALPRLEGPGLDALPRPVS
ncbi:maleylpyruvate isomerase family mycothiol-dependent enzyme [Actinomadura gamaensis]|uniref:Maleylpyruvate isomerase family mycothiol-dependent enzyme n=1 Tax=Actinomadura gamaensis TaxID=1763541 RepID=A0ABV9U129_9ACTN